jgi:hypothetical protein
VLRRLGLLLLASSCGYQAVYGGAEVEPIHLKLVRTRVPDAVASDEVLAGMREELARSGALQAGDGFPRAEVEVLLSDDASEAIAVKSGGPSARATGVSLVAHAWVVRTAGGPPERDTGDMRADDVIAVDEHSGALDLRANTFHESDALRAAGRRLGRALARKLTTVGPPP